MHIGGSVVYPSLIVFLYSCDERGCGQNKVNQGKKRCHTEATAKMEDSKRVKTDGHSSRRCGWCPPHMKGPVDAVICLTFIVPGQRPNSIAWLWCAFFHWSQQSFLSSCPRIIRGKNDSILFPKSPAFPPRQTTAKRSFPALETPLSTVYCESPSKSYPKDPH